MSNDRRREVPLQAVQTSQPDLTPIPRPGTDLETIFQEHHERVFRAAYRVVGNANDAEDVLQTVFLRLLRRDGGAHLSDSPGSYLHRAAVNGALDLLRARVRARGTPLEDVEWGLADESGERPDRRQGGREIRDRLRDAMTKLSPKAAEIFALRYLEGYGNHEIARMLGVGRSTVAVTLHRARKKLQAELRPLLGGEPAQKAGRGGRP
jgi:RNA polymerase sigma-70 factor (ECF subfamily)